jgi:hypothetical protein
MTIEWLRDLVISILGILSIIITIGLLIGLTIFFVKTRKKIRSIINSVRSIHKWLANILNLVKGFNESMNMFK